jgi:lysyl-tRNA synthetase class II
MTEMIIPDDELPVHPLPPKQVGRPKGTYVKRMTDIEKRTFIHNAAREILENHLSYGEFVKWCKDTTNMSKSQANEYWGKVWVLLKKKFELEKDKLVLKHTQKYWDVYEQALIQSDLTNARQALNDLAKLQGLAEPDKVHITGTSIKLNFGEPSE